MSTLLMRSLEEALRSRNPTLAGRLAPGLPETVVRQALRCAKIQGYIEPVVQLFTWKNGSRLDASLTEGQASPFPSSVYMFMDLEMMISHFREFEQCAVYHPRYSQVVGKYFPIFW